MNAIKWELEDLAFATLQPKVYDEIVRLVAEAAPSRDEFLAQVIEQVHADLEAAKIRATRHRTAEALLLDLPEDGRPRPRLRRHLRPGRPARPGRHTRDCYAALGVMHVRWNPLPGRFKDYIAMPKFNMYQSLHTTVLGPQGKPGGAADPHRRDAQAGRVRRRGALEVQGGRQGHRVRPPTVTARDLIWVRQLLDWQRETADPGEFLDSLRFEINSTEVYAFTPKGDVHRAAAGRRRRSTSRTPSTPRSVNRTDRRPGQRAAGAAGVELSNGDVVEILTSKAENAGPSRDWLAFVKSPRARNKIRHHFTRGRREESIESGKEAIARQMRKAGLPLQRLLTLEHLTAVAGYFKLADVSALYAAVGEGTVGAQAVVNRLISVEGGEDATADEINEDRVVTGRRRRHGGRHRTPASR